MLVNINGFKFIVLSLPHMGSTFDLRSCPGKWGTPLGWMYSVSDPSSPLDAMFKSAAIKKLLDVTNRNKLPKFRRHYKLQSYSFLFFFQARNEALSTGKHRWCDCNGNPFIN